MLVIKVEVDDGWAEDQVAEERARTAKALTETARLAAQEIRQDMPQRFTLRNSWVSKGIRADSARRDTLMARVYSVDPYMVKQDEGEVWHPDGHVAIPADARPSKTSPIPRMMLPRNLRNQKDVFKADFSKSAQYKLFPLVGLFQRVGKGKLRVLYLLKDEKHTKPSWDFADQVESAVDKYFDQKMDKP